MCDQVFHRRAELTRAQFDASLGVLQARATSSTRPSWMFRVLLGACILIIMTLYVLLTPSGGELPLDFSFGVATVWVIGFALMQSYRYRWFRQPTTSVGVFEVDFAPSWLEIRTPCGIVHRLPWPAVTHLERRPDLWVVWQDAYFGYVLPRGLFVDAETVGRAVRGWAPHLA